MGLAAAALYVTCVTNKENKTRHDVAEVASVIEVTIRDRYKGLKLALDLYLLFSIIKCQESNG
jgi:transcription initiation factor TFIIB